MPYELGEPQSSFFGFYGALYPIYVRGEAYLALNRGPEAAREFQKIIDHRGIVVSDPIGALAHLQLGRAFVSSGEKTKAKTAYGDFLTLWNDADSTSRFSNKPEQNMPSCSKQQMPKFCGTFRSYLGRLQ
jgi:hypothetical protein